MGGRCRLQCCCIRPRTCLQGKRKSTPYTCRQRSLRTKPSTGRQDNLSSLRMMRMCPAIDSHMMRGSPQESTRGTVCTCRWRSVHTLANTALHRMTNIGHRPLARPHCTLTGTGHSDTHWNTGCSCLGSSKRILRDSCLWGRRGRMCKRLARRGSTLQGTCQMSRLGTLHRYPSNSRHSQSSTNLRCTLGTDGSYCLQGSSYLLDRRCIPHTMHFCKFRCPRYT